MATTLRVQDPSGRWQQLSAAQALEQARQQLERGELERAEALLRKILQFEPLRWDALHLLGLTCQRAGKPESAAEYLRKAIGRREDVAVLHGDLANVLTQLARPEEALAEYQRALALEADSPELHSSLAALLVDLGRLEEAAIAAAKAVELRPEYPEALSNLGTALQRLGRFEQAVTCFRGALSLAPASAELHCNLAHGLVDLHRIAEGLEHYERALELDPGSSVARHNRAYALLASGDFDKGWREYEWRWRSKTFSRWRRDFSQPQWEGGELRGRCILLHAEQGLGDTLQFARYVPLVAERGATVVLETQPELVRLLSALPGVAAVKARGEVLPEFDLHCPLLSLPLACGTTLATIPSRVPYLQAPEELRRAWQERLESAGGLKVGIVWAGGVQHRNDRNRSIPLEHLAPLLANPAVMYFSFQVGPKAQDLVRLHLSQRVIDLAPLLRDFAETAAALGRMDLLITVDTAVAHLAGALGIETWLLLPFSPDWRWLLDRADSPWYPSLRLFRQTAPGDWPGVVARVAAALDERVAATAGQPAAPFVAQAPATDLARWSDTRSLDPAWNARAQVAADFIPAGATVLDLGCGAMALERYLPAGCSYLPCDLVRRDERTLVCDFSRQELPAAPGVTHVTLLGVLEYISDWRGFLKRLRGLNAPLVLSYSPTDFTAHLDRAALGWVNHVNVEALLAGLWDAGFHVHTSLRIDSNQLLLRASPQAWPARLSRRVVVLSYNNVGNFGDRLGFHLVNSILPSTAVVQHAHFKPWQLPDSEFDLAVIGIGNSVFQPVLSDELLGFLERVPQAVGIFGTQYRENLDVGRLNRLLDRLAVWFVRHEEDALLYGRRRGNLVHLGDWLISAFPMSQWSRDENLNIGPEIWTDAPLDRTIQNIQQYRSVFSPRLHPLLCAMTSAEHIAYREQKEDGSGKPSGKFRSMFLDIFGRHFPEETFFTFDRDAVASYRAKVQNVMAEMPKVLAALLEVPTRTAQAR